ncbi:hypothetical protein [Solirubrobacter soli]|uniref:hypothetical protein n=1 Tax=Solirubrobacter soli TaxID=363832 RepID=UPI0004270A1F|nr:hypothetical protein [Solirubrobacter soli]
MQLTLSSPTTVRPGRVVDFTAQATNLSATACDVSLSSMTFTPPTGLPVPFGAVEVPVAATVKQLATGQWTAPAATGDYTAKFAVAGTAHDGPDSPFSIEKTRVVKVVDPKLELTITPTPASGPAPLTVTFHYFIKNTSTPAGDLTTPSINHPECKTPVYASGDANDDKAIDTGETWEFTCTTTYQTRGAYSANAVATATSALDGGNVSGVGPTTTVTAEKPASTAHLTLTRSDTPATGFAPLSVARSYTVVNDGPSTPIADVQVQDGACSPVVTSAANTPLAANESRVFTCSAVFGNIGTFTSTAVASGVDTITGDPVASAQVPASVTVALPPETVPATRDDETPSTNVKFSYTGRFSPARSCKGTVTLTLKAGTKKLATKRVKLDSKCRYKVSFTIARTRLGTATKVTVTAKAGKRSGSRTFAVPKS